jgi:hypothetical protein
VFVHVETGGGNLRFSPSSKIAKFQAQLLQRSVKGISQSAKTLFEKKGKAKPRKNQFSVPLIPSLMLLAGVDPNPGHQSLLWHLEVGLDLIVPNTLPHGSTSSVKQSGGRIISHDAKTQQGKSSEWRQPRSDTSPLGEWFRRMKGKIGPRGAIVATQIGSHHLQNDDHQNTLSGQPSGTRPTPKCSTTHSKNRKKVGGFETTCCCCLTVGGNLLDAPFIISLPTVSVLDSDSDARFLSCSKRAKLMLIFHFFIIFK